MFTHHYCFIGTSGNAHLKANTKFNESHKVCKHFFFTLLKDSIIFKKTYTSANFSTKGLFVNFVANDTKMHCNKTCVLFCEHILYRYLFVHTVYSIQKQP